MRIALFSETYLPNINGVATHVKSLKDGLEKLGHQVLVVTADKNTRHHYVKDGVLHCPAIEIKRIYGVGVSTPISRKRMRLIEDFAPDVLHIHNEFGIGISGIIAAKRLKKPIVYTLHTMYDQYIYYIFPRLFLRFATRFSHSYAKIFARFANELTGPSAKVEEYFRSIGINKATNIIPNPVDLDAFSPDNVTKEKKDAFREKYNIPSDHMIACFVGRLGKEKSVDVLLDYWSQTICPEDKIHLVIIGGGPFKEILEKQAKELGINEMVSFTGMVNHQDMPNYYAACDIYVTASLSDTNSISMLEGMAMGMPVLQRYDELNKDQVREGINGYSFSNAEDMGSKLKEIKNMSPEELSLLKASVIESVKSQGSSNLAIYMVAIYSRIMEEMKERRKL